MLKILLFPLLRLLQAEECYYCGERSVYKRTEYMTKGVCIHCYKHLGEDKRGFKY